MSHKALRLKTGPSTLWKSAIERECAIIEAGLSKSLPPLRAKA